MAAGGRPGRLSEFAVSHLELDAQAGTELDLLHTALELSPAQLLVLLVITVKLGGLGIHVPKAAGGDPGLGGILGDSGHGAS